VRQAFQKSLAADVVLPERLGLIVDSPKKVFYSSRSPDELVALLPQPAPRGRDGRASRERGKIAKRMARLEIKPRLLEVLLWLTASSAEPGSPGRLGPASARCGSIAAGLRRTSLPPGHVENGRMLTKEGALAGAGGASVRVAPGDVADFPTPPLRSATRISTRRLEARQPGI